MPEKFGIIITRHMSTTESAMYWMYCIDAVRVHYPNIPIVVIDDNSAPEFLTPALKKEEDALQKKTVGSFTAFTKKEANFYRTTITLCQITSGLSTLSFYTTQFSLRVRFTI